MGDGLAELDTSAGLVCLGLGVGRVARAPDLQPTRKRLRLVSLGEVVEPEPSHPLARLLGLEPEAVDDLGVEAVELGLGSSDEGAPGRAPDTRPPRPSMADPRRRRLLTLPLASGSTLKRLGIGRADRLHEYDGAGSVNVERERDVSREDRHRAGDEHLAAMDAEELVALSVNEEGRTRDRLGELDPGGITAGGLDAGLAELLL